MFPSRSVWLLLPLLLFLAACDDDGTEADPDPNFFVADSGVGTGELFVEPSLENESTLESGVLVYLYVSRQDMIDNFWLARVTTGPEGVADFGFLNPGNYYLTAEKTIGPQLYGASTVTQVQTGKVIVMPMILRPQ